ncbi:MAG: phosphoribosylformylglycinamidine synthase [Clostridia bacterium]|nr:phosphoribosylformylglycinamidine synthase [Clostridia bacterium]
MIKRIFVEKKKGLRHSADKIKSDVKGVLGIQATFVRVFLRYDVEGLEGEDFDRAVMSVFSEPPVDNVYFESLPPVDAEWIYSEYLPGQYDQRADSAAQCVQMLTLGARPLIRCATVYAFGGITAVQREKISSYLINPVEARPASAEKPETLRQVYDEPQPPRMVEGFVDFDEDRMKKFHAENGFAMSVADLLFVQAHFRSQLRNPTETELKVIDTYWSDHCRHTTFLTALQSVKIKSDNPAIEKAYNTYLQLFNEHHKGRPDKYPSLMDIATIGVRELKKQGKLDNLDASEEINACSIKVTAEVDGKPEQWLVMFKNETHNHPTEIEPFGGAATCLGGAIRDPLSGRVYVYQAMRVTGAADITESYEKTLKGKLPQRVISKTAAAGFSSYGNQIGLATGGVHEVYHPGYVAKRLETGFVVGAAPAENVVRSVPEKGDVVLLIGGATGRDGCGGATGSSKAHTEKSLDTCGAEVQKGNPLTERKIQRLFRNGEVTRLIKRCNDFGAGGVSVAIGELSPGLDIDLDAVPKKYYGLTATELAISESQERMAVVVRAEDEQKMAELCDRENLTATRVATVTDLARMRMFCGGNLVVDLPRKFLDSNGVRQQTDVVIKDDNVKFFDTLPKEIETAIKKGDMAAAVKATLSELNVCSQKGLGEIFDSTIGAGSVLMPFGGKYQLTPSVAMAALLPTSGITDTATVCAYGFDPYLMSESPFVGAVYSVLTSVVKAVCAGAPVGSIRLTLQEFFERVNADPVRWGKPTAALLGALTAQLGLGLGAIGGKDSMSGSFEKIDVPPTLISFALGVTKAQNVIDNVLRGGEKVYRLRLKTDKFGMPDFEHTLELLKLLSGEIARGRVKFATVAEQGGAAAAIIKSALGNKMGFRFAHKDTRNLFLPRLGDILVALSSPDDFVGYDPEYIGETTDDGKIVFAAQENAELTADMAAEAFLGKLDGVYPVTAQAFGKAENVTYTGGITAKPAKHKKKVKVFIPVFPGTNCEYDTAKRFALAGAEPIVRVIRNRSAEELNDSLDEMAKCITESQIIAFPGGFSGGDEPDGSGKFIATAFRCGKITDAIDALLYKRDGLILGICNGFQALVKLGLLPEGKICELTDDAPTLTFNNIARHVSTAVNVRVASNLSPWLAATKPGDVFKVAVSHGEGKFVANDEKVAELIRNGQIATQYCDMLGNATMTGPYNPNGSVMAIEGITSRDGRVFGKMGHSERIGDMLMKNVPGDADMKLFESGVKYFTGKA